MSTLEILKRGVCLQCKTENHARELLYHLHKAGCKWTGGDSLLKHTYWNYYKERTYYNVSDSTLEVTFGSGGIPNYYGDNLVVYEGWEE